MVVYLLNGFEKKIKVINDYFYLTFEPSFMDITQFQIKVKNIEKYRFMFHDKQNYTVYFHDYIDDEFGIIDNYLYEVDADTGEKVITFTGRLSKYILENRAISSLYFFRNEYSINMLEKLLSDIRLPCHRGAENKEEIIAKTEPIPTKRIGYGVLYDKMIPLMRKDMIGLRMSLTLGKEQEMRNYYSKGDYFVPTNFESLDVILYRGKDRTIGNKDKNFPVVFSSRNGEIITDNFIKSNVMPVVELVVAGEITTVNPDTPDEPFRYILHKDFKDFDYPVSVFNMCIKYVDARDIQREKPEGGRYTLEEYDEMLLERGLEKIAEEESIITCEMSHNDVVTRHKYGKDFFLGDKITLVDEELDTTLDTYVMGVIKTFDNGIWSTDFVFSDGIRKTLDIQKAIKKNEQNIEIAINGIGGE